jgi:hypothetical protein
MVQQATHGTSRDAREHTARIFIHLMARAGLTQQPLACVLEDSGRASRVLVAYHALLGAWWQHRQLAELARQPAAQEGGLPRLDGCLAGQIPREVSHVLFWQRVAVAIAHVCRIGRAVIAHIARPRLDAQWRICGQWRSREACR